MKICMFVVSYLKKVIILEKFFIKIFLPINVSGTHILDKTSALTTSSFEPF
jgi:hypothetical protein